MNELAALARFVHVGAAVLLAGSFAFMLLVARPAFARAGLAVSVHAARLQRRLAFWSLLLLVASALAVVWLQAASLGEDGSAAAALSALITDTAYGRAWTARMALAAVLGVLLLLARGARDSTADPAAGFALSAGILASLALSGHAAAAEGADFLLQVGSVTLHVLAAGVWLGALLPLAALLRDAAAGRGAGSVIVIREATLRFSLLGIACVALLIVTGIINAWNLVGGVPELLGTPYGRLLMAKLALLLPLLGVAAYNLARLNPAISSAPAEEAGALSRRLGRNAAIEAAIGLAVILAAAFLATTPPARHVAPDWPFAFRWDWALLDRSPAAQMLLERGLVWFSGGIGVLVLAVFLEPKRMLLGVIGAAMVGYSLFAIVKPVTLDAYPTSYHRPAVPYHAISIASGRRLYEAQCAGCHGPDGRGAAAADLTAPGIDRLSAGDLYWRLAHARPALDSEARWDLVNFTRALWSADRARALSPVANDGLFIAAPDFAYVDSSGRARSLKDHRGERLVLLVLAGPQSAARVAALQREAVRLSGAGAEVIVVPHDRGALLRGAHVVEGNAEIHDAYALFRPTASNEPVHAELLIDRQGYLRARWLASQRDGWSDLDILIAQLLRLRAEVPRAAPPDDHVH